MNICIIIFLNIHIVSSKGTKARRISWMTYDARFRSQGAILERCFNS